MTRHGVDVVPAWSMPVTPDHAVGSGVGAGAVVGQEHHEGVVRHAHRVEKLHDAPYLGVGVGDEPGVHLHHAGIELAFLGGQVLPWGHPGRTARVDRAGWYNSQFLLPQEGARTQGLPPVFELSAVGLDPGVGDLVG